MHKYHPQLEYVVDVIWEELTETTWKLYGPDSYDLDFKNSLSPEELEKEWERWRAFVNDNKLNTVQLDGYIEGLQKALKFCKEASEKRERYS